MPASVPQELRLPAWTRARSRSTLRQAVQHGGGGGGGHLVGSRLVDVDPLQPRPLAAHLDPHAVGIGARGQARAAGSGSTASGPAARRGSRAPGRRTPSPRRSGRRGGGRVAAGRPGRRRELGVAASARQTRHPGTVTKGGTGGSARDGAKKLSARSGRVRRSKVACATRWISIVGGLGVVLSLRLPPGALARAAAATGFSASVRGRIAWAGWGRAGGRESGTALPGRTRRSPAPCHTDTRGRVSASISCPPGRAGRSPGPRSFKPSEEMAFDLAAGEQRRLDVVLVPEPPRGHDALRGATRRGWATACRCPARRLEAGDPAGRRAGWRSRTGRGRDGRRALRRQLRRSMGSTSGTRCRRDWARASPSGGWSRCPRDPAAFDPGASYCQRRGHRPDHEVGQQQVRAVGPGRWGDGDAGAGTGWAERRWAS